MTTAFSVMHPWNKDISLASSDLAQTIGPIGPKFSCKAYSQYYLLHDYCNTCTYSGLCVLRVFKKKSLKNGVGDASGLALVHVGAGWWGW